MSTKRLFDDTLPVSQVDGTPSIALSLKQVTNGSSIHNINIKNGAGNKVLVKTATLSRLT
jgi:ribosomal protein L2